MKLDPTETINFYMFQASQANYQGVRIKQTYAII